MSLLSTAIDISVSLLVRAILLAQICCVFYFLKDYYDEYANSALIICVLIILIDTVYVLLKRHGKEYKWFSITCFSYSVTLNILVWYLMHLKLDIYKDNVCPSDKSFNETDNNDILKSNLIFVRLLFNFYNWVSYHLCIFLG